MPDVLLGPQRPRVHSVPEYRSSLGADAADVAELAGLVLDPWQRDALTDIMAVRSNGWPVSRTAAMIVTRQNGKGSCNEAYVLEGMFMSNLSLITYTAHEYKTAQEMFLRIRALVENTPALSKRLKPNGIRLVNGEQSIELKSGARLKFMARTGGSGRGFSGDRIILDEAQELKGDHMAALVPTLVTRPHAQILMTGSAPKPDAEVLPAVMERGRAGSDPVLCYLEWSVKDPEDGQTVDLDDRELWRQANPGYGIRLFDEAIVAERGLLDDESFARERLGIMGGGGFSAVIDRRTWSGIADPKSQIAGRMMFAIDTTPDRSRTSIGVAGLRSDGLAHLEVIENRRGTNWVVDRADELTDRWEPEGFVIDPAGPAGSLIPELEARGIPVITVTAREYAQACGSLLDLVTSEQLRHLDQPSLNAAVDTGRKRPLGDLWAWHRRDASADISPLVAGTLAVHGLRSVKGEELKTNQAVFI